MGGNFAECVEKRKESFSISSQYENSVILVRNPGSFSFRGRCDHSLVPLDF